MNELQRQHYLSALGLDTYMPRWQLPFAPVSIACKLPEVRLATESQPSTEFKIETAITHAQPTQIHKPETVTSIVSPVNNLIDGIFESKKLTATISKPISAADILAQLDSKPVVIDGFSLSIWRPAEGVMIIDARNTSLALPTELFLNNVLRVILAGSFKLQEEVLRWPMIENSFTKRTVNDARVELQTWLSVQHEIRPIRHLWLMGSNSANYLLPENSIFSDSIFQISNVADSIINALVLPSLNELLKDPGAKKKLFSVIRKYHSVSQ